MKTLSWTAAALVLVTAASTGYAQNAASWDDWLSRTEASVDAFRGGKPGYAIETVQPLYQNETKQDTLFTQLRASSNDRFGERRNTFNLGLGYRNLFANNTALAGINVFYDVETKHNLKRWSLGGELRWSAFDLYANKYFGISDWTTTNGGAQEKPLDGYDIDLASQLPYMPWAKIHLINYRWNKERATEDLSGNKLTFEGDLTPNIALEFGRNFNTNNIAEDGNFVMLRFRLNGNAKRPTAVTNFLASRSFDARDMSSHTLDRVRRNNLMVVERSGDGIVIARGN